MRRAFATAIFGAVLLAGGGAMASHALAQETFGTPTIQQFNAANAENRRHTGAGAQLRDDAHQLRQDQTQGLVICQGTAAAAACAGNLQQGIQQRGLMLRNQALDERNTHVKTLRAIGVNPLQ